MEPLMAAGLLKMFFSICEKGPGAIVPELIGLAIPGSDIVTAAEILGVDLGGHAAVRRDPALQRYLCLDVDRALDSSSLNRSITTELDNE
jgi:hypothetical protein